jgi:hypothetical protein
MRSLGWFGLALVAGAVAGASVGLLRRRAPAEYSATYTQLERDAATPATAADPYNGEPDEIYRVSPARVGASGSSGASRASRTSETLDAAEYPR